LHFTVRNTLIGTIWTAATAIKPSHTPAKMFYKLAVVLDTIIG